MCAPPMVRYGSALLMVLSFTVGPSDVRADKGRLAANETKKLIKKSKEPAATLPGWFVNKQMPPRGASGGPIMAKMPKVPVNTPESLRRAIEDLIANCGNQYPEGKNFLARLDALEKGPGGLDKNEFEKLHREALLANPVLDFDKLLVVTGGAVFPANWQTLASANRSRNCQRAIAILDGLDDGGLKTIHKPEGFGYAGRLDLSFDAEKILFSASTSKKTFAVFEIGVDGKNLRQVSPDMGDDVDNYDACYLPDGKILFNSTAVYSGVPCVGGKDPVANFHVMDKNGKNVRRICFEQDGNWHPSLMADGRVMYLRWEYTDTPHYFTRVLMRMNPDGTDQKAFYGSNSYWPNSLFYARQCPGSPNKFVGIVSGHHGVRRVGPLVLFDVGKGRHEVDGAVQTVPGFGRPVVNITADNLAAHYPDRMADPYPLSDKYFLASDGKGIYLLDVFDNMLLLKRGGLFEPYPLRKRKAPPAAPQRVNPKSKEATVMISDIYEGPGLAGVPRGTVRKLRIFKYEYGPRNRGGHAIIGRESGWDVKMMLGTVPVDPDGSANFLIPADTPISLQPLDAEGKALQLMRSWLVGMPGETLSCVGCHEHPDTAPPAKASAAFRRKPDKIQPWYGPVRGLSFEREVQPVLDKYCAGCHDMKGRLSDPGRSYNFLTSLVRRGGPEGDYHLLAPLEYHANTSPWIQKLEKGHREFDVKLDEEAWDRLITWMDLNAPRIGTWTEAGANKKILARRLELRERYTSVSTNPEAVVNPYVRKEGVYVAPEERKLDIREVSVEGWPFNENSAREMQRKAGRKEGFEIKLDGFPLPLKFVRIPAGEFVMGSNEGFPDELPVAAVRIEKPFYLCTTEITLGQYRLFDPGHENGVYDRRGKDQSVRGFYQNNPFFPVIRVSWKQAMAYCKWLSKETGRNVTLPTEAQWEWAARAGTSTEHSFTENPGEYSNFAAREYGGQLQKTGHYADGAPHLAPVGRYKPNPFGLLDMHGNAAEWTRSGYKPYPYNGKDGRNNDNPVGKKAVRGGSWNSLPKHATSACRLGYPAWQGPFDVGFRVMIEE